MIGASMLEMHQAQVIANLLMGDLFQRFPKVKWIVVESGIGYIPYIFERLAYQIEDARAIPGCEALPHPQKQFQDHMYACFWFEDHGPRYELEMLGFDNVLFETDFPHPTCLYPGAVEHGIQVLEKWGSEVVRKVMSENSAKLYEIPI
jgi:predicted TIM-barrel fold metal-dependent hydrolase